MSKTAYVVVRQHWEFDDACSVNPSNTETIQGYSSIEKALEEAKKLNRIAYRKTFFQPYEGEFDALENSWWAYHIDNYQRPQDYFHFENQQDLENFLTKLGVKFTYGDEKYGYPPKEIDNIHFPPQEDPYAPPAMSDDHLDEFISQCKITFYSVKELQLD